MLLQLQWRYCILNNLFVTTKRLKHLIISMFLLIGATIVFQGCNSIFEEGGSEAGDIDYSGSNFFITVKVENPSTPSTRADHEDDAEEDGTPAENYIDIANDDISLLLFDKAGNILANIVSEEGWTYNLINDGANELHTFETEVVFPEDMPSGIKDYIRANGVQVLVVANWNTADTQAAYADIFTKGDDTFQSLTEIWQDDENYNYNYHPSASGSWTPDIDARRLIPMFGIAQSSPFRMGSKGYESSVTVQMQRSLAKIEVIDAIDQEGVGIGDVSLTRYNTSARFIPNLITNPGWNASMAQVGVSSLPAGVRTVDGLTFVKEGEDKWVAYVPEMELSRPGASGELPADRTHIDVTIETSSALDGIYDGGVYPIHFARYSDAQTPTVPDESWNHILRNHIYRYTVTKVGMDVKIHLQVIPWVVDDDEIWDFTDHVSLKPLVWEGSYDNINHDTAEVTLILEPGKPLEGMFQIMSPVNGRWYATLVPLDDAVTSAVSFCDENGNIPGGSPLLEVSGIIPGPEESAVYICPTNYGSEQKSRFRLEFYVENMGRWFEVPMVREGTASNFIIVRPSNLIE